MMNFKRIQLFLLLFTYINSYASVSDTVGYRVQDNSPYNIIINPSCANAVSICSNSPFFEFSPTFKMYYFKSFDDEGNPVPANQYFSFNFSEAGQISISSSFDNQANIIIYGPLPDSRIEACDLVNSYSAPMESILLNDQNPGHVLNYQPGNYIIQVLTDVAEGGIIINYPEISEHRICSSEFNCEDCISSFRPIPGKYVVSAWVKQENAPFETTNYLDPKIKINFSNLNLSYTISPEGKIIDGWQRIEGVITIPYSAQALSIELISAQGTSLFDDIRFFPFDGSMMSYVYDPESLRLMAELDERNYATFYEYDEEGKLIRVKKETEKGVMTIQENRDNIRK